MPGPPPERLDASCTFPASPAPVPRDAEGRFEPPATLEDLAHLLDTEPGRLVDEARGLLRGAPTTPWTARVARLIDERLLDPWVQRSARELRRPANPARREAARSWLQCELPRPWFDRARIDHVLVTNGLRPRLARALSPFLLRADPSGTPGLRELLTLPFERELLAFVRSIGGQLVREDRRFTILHDHRLSLASCVESLVAASWRHEVAPLERIRVR